MKATNGEQISELIVINYNHQSLCNYIFESAMQRDALLTQDELDFIE